ncbi:MAG: hypothetical protein HY083_07480 [Gammaproteobacteria bacterium]|nr:hypothetical protein [Gammaproteobacteria bacterium]
MERRKISIGALLLVAFYLLYLVVHKIYQHSPVSDTTPSKSSAASVVNPSLNAELEKLHNRWRLRPDARFIQALAELHVIAAGTAPKSMTVEFRNGAWYIASLDGARGTFPEIPGFEDGMNLLRDNARRALASFSLSTTVSSQGADGSFDFESHSLHPRELNAELKRLNERWTSGVRTPTILKQAAQALSAYAYVSLDAIETADVVLAKALATLALAQVATGEPLALEESLIAQRLGYSSHARNLALKLSPNHAWRLWLERQDDELGRRAKAQQKGSAVHYLWLQRLAEQDRYEEWVQTQRRAYPMATLPVHVLGQAHLLAHFNAKQASAVLLPHLVLGNMLLEIEGGDLATQLRKIAGKDADIESIKAVVDTVYDFLQGRTSHLVDYFETHLDTLSAKFQGPFLDNRTYQAYYRGYFFTALYRYGLLLLDSYSAVEAAARFSKALGDSKRGTARDFQRWYRHLVEAKQGAENLDELLADLRALPNFGAQPLFRTFREQLPLYEFGSPEITNAAQFLIERMDTRPDHRFEFAGIAHRQLMYPSLTEKLYASIRRDNPADTDLLRAWLGMYYGKPEEALAVARDSGLRPYLRAEALTMVAPSDRFENEIRQVFDELVKANPDLWVVRKRYIEVLEQLGDHKAAQQQAREWLLTMTKAGGQFDRLQAFVALARAQLALGEPDRAWMTLEPFIDSYYGPIMIQAVEVALALKDYALAERVASALMERYSNHLESMIPLLKTYWISGRYRPAALLLKQWPYTISAEAWRWKLGTAFAEIFSANPTGGNRAFQALLEAGLDPWNLKELSLQVAKKANPALAFDMQSLLHGDGQNQIKFLASAYEYLHEARGFEVARQWHDQHMPTNMRNFSSVVYYYDGQYDLIWDLIPQPEKDDHPDAVWLMRTMAYIVGDSTDARRKQLLEEYYRQADDREYHLVGKYLLDIVLESRLPQGLLNAKQMCEYAYFLGVRRLAEKRFYDAADWFRVSVEIGQKNIWEYRFAYSWLYKWRNSNRSLDVFVRERRTLSSFPITASADPADRNLKALPGTRVPAP